eukprot:TRINITY_DN345_c1_g3_i2.p1 TRINITY_DN345_c1_g3~~TRINITY_DN345_c1_g3_i2.p1  ORF type:complete len:531 (+),score=125.41 TRINITY_DN345_c1_g3_i2:236-1828(+)
MSQQPLRLGIAVQNQPQGPTVGVSKASVAAALAAQPKAPKWGPDVLAKADKMKKKTKEVMDCFKLPESEFSIQDYRCSYRRAGRMYITPNYVCFWGLGGLVDVIPFRSIIAIERSYGIIFNTGITITTEGDQTHSITALMHRDETFHILTHLWKHPLSYVHLDQKGSVVETDKEAENGNSNGGGLPSFGGFGKGKGNAFGNPFEVGAGGGGSFEQVQNQMLMKADQDASRDALRIAMEAREIGVATLEDLSEQAAIIDRIENDIEQINANLDRGDRYIRGLETFGGALKNAFTNAKVKAAHQIDEDRTLDVDRQVPVVDYPILFKNPDDSFTPAIMKLYEDDFECIAEDTGRSLRKMTYSEVANIVMRARHLHVDIRFQTANVPRLRLMSSHLQSITNELVLRTEPGQILVAFEPGVTVFEYGSFNIADKANGTGKKKDAPGSGGFKRHGGGGPSLLAQAASKEAAEEIASQDRDLDFLSDLVGDLNSIAGTMGREIDRQNNQLDQITVKANATNQRINRTHDRVNQLLK